jgi:hypothetical protein
MKVTKTDVWDTSAVAKDLSAALVSRKGCENGMLWFDLKKLIGKVPSQTVNDAGVGILNILRQKEWNMLELNKCVFIIAKANQKVAAAMTKLILGTS